MTDNLICEDPLLCDPFIKNEVVVMEDSEVHQETIKEVMEKEFDLQIKLVNSKQEAVELAEKEQVAFYVLDVYTDHNRQQEGLDALEIIKKINDKLYVSILTGFPSPEIKKMVANLGANSYKEKSFDLKNTIRDIAVEIKNYKHKILEEKLEIINNHRQAIIDELQKLENKPHPDPNIATYEALKSEPNQKWFKKYEGKYVAFMDGNLVDSDENKQDLLERLRQAKYPDKPRFVTKVEKHPRIIDEPSSLWLDIDIH
jgi:CheY-like chemotaxis protein